jgi:hypothetical protein
LPTAPRCRPWLALRTASRSPSSVSTCTYSAPSHRRRCGTGQRGLSVGRRLSSKGLEHVEASRPGAASRAPTTARRSGSARASNWPACGGVVAPVWAVEVLSPSHLPPGTRGGPVRSARRQRAHRRKARRATAGKRVPPCVADAVLTEASNRNTKEPHSSRSASLGGGEVSQGEAFGATTWSAEG